MLAKVHDFLLERASGAGDEISIEVHPPRAALPACPRPDISLPRAADRPVGRVSVGIRCGNDNRTRYLQAEVHITGHYVELARDVRAGDIIRPEDLTEVTGRLDRLPRQALLDPDRATGQQATRHLAAGVTLQRHHLRARPLVRRGQQVVIEARGSGFRVTRSAEALEPGGRNERIRVRLADREILEARVVGEGRTSVDF
ncbi:flagellar basal body P-ring formation chaperone FlgA [Halomonas saccharevitans]|uniref:Flagella basal body P-ring formation protein FlgA n=1 Tax=Halomonas saccharevitans TaxID=416872 RepID=A0ABU3NDT4_9GAMM|nr:flagellar basal body P-ring formation chaperone FlgA [Halomonas saccharevitans]MDT8879182.1 flagellar basal body P-ring formation chaperone FlgA [Halomonas saccharevitans]